MTFLIDLQDGEKLGYETEAFAIYDVMRSLIFANFVFKLRMLAKICSNLSLH